MIKHIMLINDDPDELDNIAALLESINPDCNILNAYDSDSGIHLLSQFIPELVLLKIPMLKEDGFNCLKKINQAMVNYKVPVYAISEILDPTGRLRALMLGAAGCLRKTADTKRFAENLAILLDMESKASMA